MRRIWLRSGLAALACALVVGAACRKQAPSKGEQVAEKLGRDEAVYLKRTAGGAEETVLAMDFSKVVRPASVAEFIQLFHFSPVRQGKTGTCWSFSTTSFLEAELRRMGKAEVKLSEMFIVYWEYVEKARRFIREKGASFLGQGSEPNSAIERVRQYGLVREDDYRGLAAGRSEHDHGALFREFEAYLSGLKARGDWDEAKGLAGVRAILDRHLGRPPETISADGRALTPKQYAEESLGLNPSDYVAFISFAYLPFHTRGEYKVPDNWSHGADYCNLPLYEFPLALLRSLRRGYTAVLAVDFSEPGYSGENGIAVIPSFDIPQNFIDQSSREYRFTSGASTDDHAVHCVGYKEGVAPWFLIKDSWENAYWSAHKGYYFYRDDYIRLKCLMFMVHKDAVKEVLAEFR
ncbi:MAG TPA: C1 family peptidase [Terriglobales bacterium]|nr:C1 family peptidase [Terriglobales bacterium]